MSPYLRVSDDVEHDPRFLRLSHRAFRVLVHAGAWSQRFLTDGVIPKAIALTLRYSSAAILRELLEAGRLEERADDYLIVGHSEHNDSRAVVQERKRLKAERMARWRARGVSPDSPRDAPQDAPRDASLTVPLRTSPYPKKNVQESRARYAREPQPVFHEWECTHAVKCGSPFSCNQLVKMGRMA